MFAPHYPRLPDGLAPLDPLATSHGLAMQNHLINQLDQRDDGFMPFDEWMDQALYAPGLGYYTAGSSKFGSLASDSDFITAPELTPLFGQTLAHQVAQINQASKSNHVLEFGAGSGALAASLIPALRQLGIEPIYQILELSSDLRHRQQSQLAHLNAHIEWLDTLPDSFNGCVLANEVLDAMPAKLFHWENEQTLLELGVSLTDRQATANNHNLQAPPFCLTAVPASQSLQLQAGKRMTPSAGYRSEINLRAEAWVRQAGDWLKQGALLLIDYGFPQHEYYHPQRAEGTLMCHFRHKAHSEPLIYAGLQDITTHVDFTAMANAAIEGGLDVMGYTSQARFLLNLGIADILGQLDPQDVPTYAKAVAPVQKLLSESEMGELFKVLAIGRQLDTPLNGFTSGDRRHRL